MTGIRRKKLEQEILISGLEDLEVNVTSNLKTICQEEENNNKWTLLILFFSIILTVSFKLEKRIKYIDNIKF